WKEGRHAFAFDMKNMIRVMAYGYAGGIASDYMNELGLGGTRASRIAINNAVGMMYSGGAAAGYFFHNFKDSSGNFPYRDKFYAWVQEDYQGKLPKYTEEVFPETLRRKDNFKSTPGLESFMRIFGISSYDDAAWDKLNDEFMSFSMAIEVIDIGKEIDDAKEDGTPSGGGADGDGIWQEIDELQAQLDAMTIGEQFGPNGEAIGRRIDQLLIEEGSKDKRPYSQAVGLEYYLNSWHVKIPAGTDAWLARLEAWGQSKVMTQAKASEDLPSKANRDGVASNAALPNREEPLKKPE
ncbi:MAG: hypothetical protein KDB07_11125, partial [Planctomycetes bacterium]|nr:hypothetical protein [Planctomycetota bacterium]